MTVKRAKNNPKAMYAIFYMSYRNKWVFLFLLLLIPLTNLAQEIKSHTENSLPWHKIRGLTGNEFKIYPKKNLNKSTFSFTIMPGFCLFRNGNATNQQNSEIIENLYQNKALTEFLISEMDNEFQVLSRDKGSIRNNTPHNLKISYHIEAEYFITNKLSGSATFVFGQQTETYNLLVIPYRLDGTYLLQKELTVDKVINYHTYAAGLNYYLIYSPLFNLYAGMGAGQNRIRQNNLTAVVDDHLFEIDKGGDFTGQTVIRLTSGADFCLFNPLFFNSQFGYILPLTNKEQHNYGGFTVFAGLKVRL